MNASSGGIFEPLYKEHGYNIYPKYILLSVGIPVKSSNVLTRCKYCGDERSCKPKTGDNTKSASGWVVLDIGVWFPDITIATVAVS